MKAQADNRYCVIMCGGVGSRFWPLSRSQRPKQFLDLFGTGSSLLQMTVERIAPLVKPENIILVTNEDYLDLISEQLPQIPRANILLEPARRNTAPCICWAAHHIYARCPEASIVTLPSDHLILRPDEFRQAVSRGLDYVESHEALLTLGIKPTRPDTGYGYIQMGVQCTDSSDVAKVKCFTEKPSLEMAKVLLASGDFLWNAGIFLWTAKSILQAMELHAPEVAEVFDTTDAVWNTTAEADYIRQKFPTSPSISIDYAVMEKAHNVYVMPVDIGWSDLGTWGALYDVSPKDRDENVKQGSRTLTEGCTGTIFATGPDRVVVAMGLKDYIVAERDGALLIAPRSAEQEVRRLSGQVRDKFGEHFA